MLGEELKRDGALQLGVLGLIDDTHAAFAELLDDLVARGGRANHHNTGIVALGAG
jgi:hypothetical protein